MIASIVGVVTSALLLYYVMMTSAAPANYPWGKRHHPIIRALVNLTYQDPVDDHTLVEVDEMGRYGTRSRLESESGWLVHVQTSDNKRHGCTELLNVPEYRWVALVERGVCEFSDKIHNALVHNASAVIVYNFASESELMAMDHNVADAVAIFVTQADGRRVAGLVDAGVGVHAQISVGRWGVPAAPRGVLSISSASLVLYITPCAVAAALTLALIASCCSGHLTCAQTIPVENLDCTNNLEADDTRVVTSDCIPLVSGLCTTAESGAPDGSDTHPTTRPTERRNVRLTYNSTDRVNVAVV